MRAPPFPWPHFASTSLTSYLLFVQKCRHYRPEGRVSTCPKDFHGQNLERGHKGNFRRRCYICKISVHFNYWLLINYNNVQLITQLTAYLAVWYLGNIYYNIFNKKACIALGKNAAGASNAHWALSAVQVSNRQEISRAVEANPPTLPVLFLATS